MASEAERRLAGLPVSLAGYAAETIVNRQFSAANPAIPDRFFLPEPLRGLLDDAPIGTWAFVDDDNRGAILPDPVATLDGLEFYLSVKGVGSSVDPYQARPLTVARLAEACHDPDVRARLLSAASGAAGGVLTGERWLRGSPYGGQGLEHARTALAVSERARQTDLAGLRIAPVVKVAYLPSVLEERLRTIYWYRQYPGRFVQELRLVPSNVRVYFHSRATLGLSVAHVFDRFGLRTDARARQFAVRFARSAIPLLTLFARTLAAEAGGSERYSGLDLHDVWLDKDAVIAPDGTVFFVDLEGIEPIRVTADEVPEKIEDQIFRSLYEFTFAFAQIDRERARRFGATGDAADRFLEVLVEALEADPFVRVETDSRGATLQIRNAAAKEGFYRPFRILDR